MSDLHIEKRLGNIEFDTSNDGLIIKNTRPGYTYSSNIIHQIDSNIDDESQEIYLFDNVMFDKFVCSKMAGLIKTGINYLQMIGI